MTTSLLYHAFCISTYTHLRTEYRDGSVYAHLQKRHCFSAIFDLFDEIVKKAKKEHGSVTPVSLKSIIQPICNLPEDRLPKTQKRESLADVMRNMLNSDTSISDDDI